jgi:hypothetical protein
MHGNYVFPQLPDMSDRMTGVGAEHKLGEVLGAVAEVNLALRERHDTQAGLIERIKEWVEKVFEVLRTIAKKLAALSYSITVAAHTNSVTVSFGGQTG